MLRFIFYVSAKKGIQMSLSGTTASAVYLCGVSALVLYFLLVLDSRLPSASNLPLIGSLFWMCLKLQDDPETPLQRLEGPCNREIKLLVTSTFIDAQLFLDPT